MASLYFVESLDGVEPGAIVRVEGPEGRHASTVARVRVGESLRVADGTGTTAAGVVTSVERDTVELVVDGVTADAAPRPLLTLVQALAKGGRDEMAVQAATEIGVDRIVPWQAARSVSRWEGPKIAKGVARWQAIAHEAAKQSIRSRIPTVTSLVQTASIHTVLEARSTMVLLDPTASARLAEWRPKADIDEIALVVGPEGGIDGGELTRLETAGAVRLRLGSNVLRTSTAGPAALAVLQASLGRW
jgi:16S rRNA (uracil1498-N3)-methyltransferase